MPRQTNPNVKSPGMKAVKKGRSRRKTKEESPAPFPEEEGSEEQNWEVEKVVGKKTDGSGDVYYKVRWSGFSADDDSWEPETNLDGCQAMIQKYEDEHPSAEDSDDDEQYVPSDMEKTKKAKKKTPPAKRWMSPRQSRKKKQRKAMEEEEEQEEGLARAIKDYSIAPPGEEETNENEESEDQDPEEKEEAVSRPRTFKRKKGGRRKSSRASTSKMLSDEEDVDSADEDTTKSPRKKKGSTSPDMATKATESTTHARRSRRRSSTSKKEEKSVESAGEEDGEPEWEVEAIVDHKYEKKRGRGKGKVLKYFVKWEGWDSDSNTWQVPEDLDGCKELVEEYKKSEQYRLREEEYNPKKASEDLEEKEESDKRNKRPRKRKGSDLEQPPAKRKKTMSVREMFDEKVDSRTEFAEDFVKDMESGNRQLKKAANTYFNLKYP